MAGVREIDRYHIEAAASRLSESAGRTVEVAAVLAVAEVEAGPIGPWVSHRGRRKPVVLFEAHLFYRHSGDLPVSETHPWLSSRRWDRSLYNRVGNHKMEPDENRQWVRLEQAMQIHRAAAIKSASYGLFQVLGQNWRALDYTSPDEFYELMHQSVEDHFDSFVRFVEVNDLAVYLAALDFDAFAKEYNGPAYRQNSYAARMRQAYRRWKVEQRSLRARRHRPVRVVAQNPPVSGDNERAHPKLGWYPDQIRTLLDRDTSFQYVGPDYSRKRS